MEHKVKTLLKSKKDNVKKSQGLFNLSRNKCTKEHLVLSLRTDINYYHTENNYYNQTHQHVSELKTKLEDNGKSLENYCKEVKSKLKEFAAQVERYEKEIEKYNKEKRQITQSNEAIIKQKNNEQTELRHQYELMNSKIEIQLNQLSELEKKQKALTEKREQEKAKYNELEAKAKQCYNDLNNQYRVLLTKYEECRELEEGNADSLMVQRMQKTISSVSKEDMKIKLTEIKIRNDVLQKETEALGTKIMNTTTKNKSIEENKTVKSSFNQKDFSDVTITTPFPQKQQLQLQSQQRTGFSNPYSTVYTTHK